MMKLGSCAAALLLAANLAAADRQLFSIARGGAVFAPFNKTDKVRTVGNRLSLELPPKGGRWQGTIITPKKGEQYFDLSEGAILAVDVKNNNPYMMQLQMEIVNLKEGKDSNAFAHIAYSSIALLPGEKAPLRVRYGRAVKESSEWAPEGMQRLPDGFVKGDHKIVPDQVAQLRIWTSNPDADRPMRFELSNFRVEEPVKPLPEALKSKEAFYPFIDRFGQYKHADWPGKVTDAAQLGERKLAEDRELAAHPAIPGRNRFGGWADGPSFEATGSFRTLKHDGKWYLVDPEGKLFFSHGIDQFSGSETTGFELREHYFENLPQKSDPETRGLWGTSNPAPGKNFYRLKNLRPAVFNYYGRNLKRKYGDDWRNIHRRLMHDRAASWGINTLGNWSWGDYARVGRTPYCLQAYSDGPVIKGHTGTWQHFEDVFDPKFEESIVSNLSRGWKFAAGDPMCIGAFVDNEHRWGNETALAEAVLRSPADQAAKQEFRRRLEKRYGDIAGLNAAWKSSYASWDAFAAETALPDPDAAKDDLKAFNDALIERYFEGCRAAVKRVLPGKLYLGCRFAGVPRAELVKTAAKYCDLLSFNLYQYSVADFKLPDGIDMPVMIGEFHFGTINNGHSHPGLVACADDAERGEAYRHYLKSVLRHPNFVGCHYYRMIDEHPAGRTLDNENMGVGFLDICDRPCPEMVRAARDIAGEMYDIRANRQ